MITKVALVLKGYPRLSETFIAQEIKALEQRGLQIQLVSLRHPTDSHVHPIHREIKAPVNYLPEYLHQEPWRVVKALFKLVYKSAFWRLLVVWWRDYKRDRTRNRLRRLGQALVLAVELPAATQWLYAHFIHTPGSVTRYTSLLTGLPWSCSAHAKDIWTTPQWELTEKLNELAWLATCTQANQQYLQSLSAAPEKVMLVYHGLDFNRFNTITPPETNDSSVSVDNKSGKAKNTEEICPTVVQLISVGRAVAKKGYDVLLQALAQLPSELSWRFVHIGGGPLLTSLKQQAANLGIADKVRWLGAKPQEEVLAQYRQSAIFVLASKITEDGDRDGLPNVLMEAQSQGVACIASDISGIPELIIDKKTGLLVPQGDVAALTHAIAKLISDSELRYRLAVAGQQRVTEEFSLATNIERLAEQFGLAYPESCSKREEKNKSSA
ncbi:glycosyltransferase family 4 protein [Spartinivicinus poritis]|uniref:Glycosyltransferase family 4 protein n=1 Tax=Spartinivicinus poritis TaxID=2994640 RepID=A0ABT5UBR9_9GAMM|nr:glycosyltransferase family 4 protein [Spartinivicinus sp. A2-2]MDE1463426.1 glycosyltransferase family 4 protein [Spartinivicinus sp. A2-2]